MNEIIKERINLIAEICKKYKVKNLYAFGSVCSERFNEKSDIDLLVNFDKNISIEEYTDNYFLLTYELQNLFLRKVELITENSLSNPYFINSLEKNKIAVYEG